MNVGAPLGLRSESRALRRLEKFPIIPLVVSHLRVARGKLANLLDDVH